MASSSASLLSHLSFLSWLLLVLPRSSLSQPFRNISQGSSLSTLTGNSSWISPSGEFAFGFYGLPNKNLSLLAIWFNEIPERTVVWSANGGNPVERGSKLELTTNGQLVLYDNKGKPSWQPEINDSSFTAAILDTGEFVLRDVNFSRVWGTFHEPTDTILPTQKLHRNRILSSRRAKDDYSNGKFQLHLQEDGNLVLYTANVLTGFTYKFESQSLGNGSELAFDENGNIGLLQTNGTISNLTRGDSFPTREFHHRATIDVDGVFRHYYFRKSGQGTWSIAGAVPSDICMAITSDPGSGVCGFNSFCKSDDKQGRVCECPTGFSYLNPNNTLEGCKPNFAAQNCAPMESRNGTVVFEMAPIANTTWVVSDFELYGPVGEGSCADSCLNDCLCAVAVFDNGTCLKKRLPLSNGRAGPSINAKTLVKVSKSIWPSSPPDLCKGKRRQATLVLVGSVLLGGSGFLNILLVAAIALGSYHCYHKMMRSIREESSLLQMNLRSFTFKQLEEATCRFKEELGNGAFGTVYKGVLPLASGSASAIAVKRLDTVVQENEREFKTEVSAIGQTHHRNLVRLLGFCDEGSHRLLVYEYMSNGSLAGFLFGDSRLNWSQRLQIAMGIARGLMYLHEECGIQIIHCDIKPQNILLDDYLVARISDFGIAKLLKTDQTRTSTAIRGTRGYLAPEWFKNVPVTVKVDVYSFGIVLLEIICCRKHLEVGMEDEDEVILKDWAYRCCREGRLDLLVGDEKEAMRDRKVLERMVMVAICCVQEDPSLRPSMKRAVRMMAGVAVVSLPVHPDGLKAGQDLRGFHP